MQWAFCVSSGRLFRGVVVIALVVCLGCQSTPEPAEQESAEPGATESDAPQPEPEATSGVRASDVAGESAQGSSEVSDGPEEWTEPWPSVRGSKPVLCDGPRRDAVDDPLFPGFLFEHLSEQMHRILESPQQYRFQLLVGQVSDHADGGGCLIQHGYRVDAEYFYPASSIKTIGAIGALDPMLRKKAERTFGLNDELWFHREGEGEPASYGSLREIIEKTLVVSSNRGHNRLFDLVGHRRMNQRMWDRKFESLRMHHRFFSDRTLDEERRSPRIDVEVEHGGDSNREMLFSERESELKMPLVPAERTSVGRSYVEDGEVVDGPMDFSQMNYLSLADHQRKLVALVRPDLTELDLGLSQEHRSFLVETMSGDPRQVIDGDGSEVMRRFKPLWPGVSEIIAPERIRYVNKGGRAYGFHIENAYIADEDTGQGIFVTAALYVNDNDRLNDNDYQYDEVSFPFYRELGRLMARHFIDSPIGGPPPELEL